MLTSHILRIFLGVGKVNGWALMEAQRFEHSTTQPLASQSIYLQWRARNVLDRKDVSLIHTNICLPSSHCRHSPACCCSSPTSVSSLPMTSLSGKETGGQKIAHDTWTGHMSYGSALSLRDFSQQPNSIWKRCLYLNAVSFFLLSIESSLVLASSLLLASKSSCRSGTL